MRPVCLHYDVSTLYTTLPHNLKINLLILLKKPAKEKALLTLHETTEKHFHFGTAEKYHAWSCQNVCNGTKLYRQVVGLPMSTYCAPQGCRFIFVLL